MPQIREYHGRVNKVRPDHRSLIISEDGEDHWGIGRTADLLEGVLLDSG